MIKVTLSTMTAERAPLPTQLAGLDAYTLQNLQTELQPVPEFLEGIEYWPGIDDTPPIDKDTHKLDGTEVLSADADSKTVSIVLGTTPLTASEINEGKPEVRRLINKWRDKNQAQNVEYFSHEWDADDRGRGEINNAITIFGAGAPFPADFKWTTANDMDIALSLADIVTIGALIADQYIEYHKQARAHKKNLKAATTKAQIAAIKALVE